MSILKKEDARGVMMAGLSARVDTDIAPQFKPGDKVRAKMINPTGHTRLPRYARGKVGTVYVDHGIFVTPDTNAHGKGEHPQHVYCVAFTSQELWGPEASAKDKVYIDMWEDYVEAAS
ncbi:nitrile hydratase subunit beta [Phaeobacter gallaeciensis]|uniref:SH3-like domain-containing protein n=1 Tax=Phaeobacter gallaeciensis TaxID=60890 RepID=UPI00237F1F5D|nr:SH3-like domain-containing protein [Phaeobacter gallaeciensis]MDE4305823.1 nitrile hydratase subunit beta [Phaeobacter gallaeciensis]MDE4310196.1 nitrile hydratase subunit beta [Phaeobacter gallaeciensis]MDE4314708.1 nitrile hydratase subunit beta [Phaeobacter gallaeciensis]MDE4319099.1 nitrile hydratase subunit beta [Phaeobacter gallaeciensis]MDE4323573.1 nitrile hydratase subunit beta [Phaeobacter gallaeciensis]